MFRRLLSPANAGGFAPERSARLTVPRTKSQQVLRISASPRPRLVTVDCITATAESDFWLKSIFVDFTLGDRIQRMLGGLSKRRARGCRFVKHGANAQAGLMKQTTAGVLISSWFASECSTHAPDAWKNFTAIIFELLALGQISVMPGMKMSHGRASTCRA